MAMIDELRTGKWLMLLLCIVLCVVDAQAIGFAPLGVLGMVEREGVPVVGVDVQLKAFVDGQQIAEGEWVVSNEEGMFFAVVAVPDPFLGDVQVIIAADELYVALLEDVVGWQRYDATFELSDDILVQPAVGVAVVSPSSPSFEAAIAALLEGEVDDALLERYNLSVEDHVPVERAPEVERPAFVRAPDDAAVVVKDVSPVVLEVAAVLVIAVCFFVIRFELRRFRR